MNQRALISILSSLISVAVFEGEVVDDSLIERECERAMRLEFVRVDIEAAKAEMRRRYNVR